MIAEWTNQRSIPLLPVARHVPTTWHQSLNLNAACYACIALLFEMIRLMAQTGVARLRQL